MHPLVPDVDKIAVLRANALGDYLFSLPALYALRGAYPGAEITLIGAPWHVRTLTGRPGPVDRVVLAPAVDGLRAPCDGDESPERFYAWAREQRFDLAVQLHGGGRTSNPVVGSLGGRLTVGLRAADAPPLDRWLPYVYYQPEVFRYLEVVGLVGAAPVTYRPVFELTHADRAEADAAVGRSPRPRVALHPGATDPRRRWPADRFAVVGDALAAAGAEVLVTGTGAEWPIVDEVRTRMSQPSRAVVDEVSIGGLAALYAGCALVVANDTGPLHLAEAVGARTVGMYWVGNMINGAPVDRARHRPLVSWTIACPVCGRDCTRDIYPARGGGNGCRHTPSFVADIPAVEAEREALDLLAAAEEVAAGEAVAGGAAAEELSVEDVTARGMTAGDVAAVDVAAGEDGPVRDCPPNPEGAANTANRVTTSTTQSNVAISSPW